MYIRPGDCVTVTCEASYWCTSDREYIRFMVGDHLIVYQVGWTKVELLSMSGQKLELELDWWNGFAEQFFEMME